MPCISNPVATPTQREQMRAAIARLDAALALGSIKIVVGRAGGIAFQGWQDNAGVSDLCAYRALASANSPALRRALARAEAMAGTQISKTSLAAGLHSHDGGNTWSTH